MNIFTVPTQFTFAKTKKVIISNFEIKQTQIKKNNVTTVVTSNLFILHTKP